MRKRDAIENTEANIVFLATMPDKKLIEKLETIYLQSKIAIKKGLTTSLALLEIWRSQVIEARIYKAENNIPDAPNEIELAIADIETIVAKTEQRQDIFEEIDPPVQRTRPKRFEQDDDSQLSLF